MNTDVILYNEKVIIHSLLSYYTYMMYIYMLLQHHYFIAEIRILLCYWLLVLGH